MCLVSSSLGSGIYHPWKVLTSISSRCNAPIRAIRRAWERNRDLLGGASSLAATTCITSALGFAYWAFAARLYPQQSVGYGSAAVSAMTLLGTAGMLGLGTVLIGELPRRTAGGGLVSAALLTSGFGSLLFGLIFIIAAPQISGRFHDMSRTTTQSIIFIVGVAFTSVTMVFDQATIGLMRGSLQFTRNLAFALTKLIILPVVAFVIHDQLGVGITLSWVVGTVASVVPILFQLHINGSRVFPKPDWAILRGLGRTALAHNWLNLAITIPRSFIPVLVTVVVSPTANAAFYAAWTLTGFLYIVPMHLATVLFAIAAADPKVIARKLRFSLRLSVVIGMTGIAGLSVGAHIALGMFGAGYAREATIPMLLMLIGYLPTIPKTHYIAVCRATGRVSRAAAVLTVSAIVEIIGATLGGDARGLTGLTIALVGVFVLEGLVTTPPVLRSAFGNGRHRRGRELSPDRYRSQEAKSKFEIDNNTGDLIRHDATNGFQTTAGKGFFEDGSGSLTQRERQERGLAMLMSLSRSVGSDIFT
jgi:O-antigen/teichoic acid export membrane protein